MANYGVKVSKEGQNISSGDREDYIFNSKYVSKSILYTFKDSLSTVASDNWVTYEFHHGLGYKPQVLVLYRLSGSGDTWTELVSRTNLYANICGTDMATCINDGGNLFYPTVESEVETTTTKLLVNIKARFRCAITMFGDLWTHYKACTYDLKGYIFMEEVPL